VADIIHKNFPGQTNTPVGTPGFRPQNNKFDWTKIHQDLGVKFRSTEETVNDTVAQFLNWKSL
jgi:nucleoside-diphosphate-sugar epimerase